jgi:hypothetical protein
VQKLDDLNQVLHAGLSVLEVWGWIMIVERLEAMRRRRMYYCGGP